MSTRFLSRLYTRLPKQHVRFLHLCTSNAAPLSRFPSLKSQVSLLSLPRNVCCSVECAILKCIARVQNNFSMRRLVFVCCRAQFQIPFVCGILCAFSQHKKRQRKLVRLLHFLLPPLTLPPPLPPVRPPLALLHPERKTRSQGSQNWKSR